MTAAPPLLQAENLRCVRGERVLFSGLSFSLACGETLLLTGPNGSGKTSLLRLIAGLLPPVEGRVMWRGTDLRDDPEAMRREMGFIGYAEGIKPALTVAENLSFWAALHGRPLSDATILTALRSVGLATLAGQPGRYLSAGQRRRLALARAAALEPPLLLLDEPATALDDSGQSLLLAALAAHAKRGGAAVIATHQSFALPAVRSLALGKPGAPPA
jgi:heme exporter protein A